MGHSNAEILGSDAVLTRLRGALAAQGGWMGFDEFMRVALYGPGGYYASGRQVLGHGPADGSDFVTAPELSPLFGATLGAQAAQALQATQTSALMEFGAGSGRLAHDVLSELDALGVAWQRYVIVELSPTLALRQRERLAPWGERVQWVSELPAEFEGVVLGNEVLDAMPVQLWEQVAEGQWCEVGVVLTPPPAGASVAPPAARFAFARRPPDLRDTPVPRWPAVLDEQAMPLGSITETHAQAEAFVATVARMLRRGAAFFIDYGFPQAEYYHPQRQRGTLVAHHGHRVSEDVLAMPGAQDLTAHVNFTGIALAAQDAVPPEVGAPVEVLGYTSQAHFLMNGGLLARLQHGLERLGPESAAGLRLAANAQKLLTEHEMGELFKVIAFGRGWPPGVAPLGFVQGDRTHTL
jgi:SAM-dependent MidA family methyltransferase